MRGLVAWLGLKEAIVPFHRDSRAYGTKTTIPGWTSLVCLQIIFSETILTAVGLVGSYVPCMSSLG